MYCLNHDTYPQGASGPFTSLRGQGSVGIQEVHVRHISVNPQSAEQQQTSGEETIRCRTPPPQYAEVADCLPSYSAAVRGMVRKSTVTLQIITLMKVFAHIEFQLQSNSAAHVAYSCGRTHPQVSSYFQVVNLTIQ